jgi:hypothetical protein
MMKFNFIFKESRKCTKIDLSIYFMLKNCRENFNELYSHNSNESKLGVVEEYGTDEWPA